MSMNHQEDEERGRPVMQWLEEIEKKTMVYRVIVEDDWGEKVNCDETPIIQKPAGRKKSIYYTTVCTETGKYFRSLSVLIFDHKRKQSTIRFSFLHTLYKNKESSKRGNKII